MAGFDSLHTTYVHGAQHHDVRPNDEEYKKIKSELENGGLVLKRLVKLTNTKLETSFQSEVEHLSKFRSSDFSLNLHYLYHGTSAPFTQICDEGLDERLSRNGRFGRGIYFSDNPEKCCKYAGQKGENPYLLRCKVILGDVKEYLLGEEDRTLQKEPIKTVKDGKRVYYDSVKGKPLDHNEYVIYDKRRALIEYVAFYSAPLNETTVRATRVDETILPHDRSLMTENRVNYSRRDSEASDDDTPSRSSTPVSGSNSPTSGCSTPAVSDDDAAAVRPVQYDSVPRVSTIRQRTKPVSSAANSSTAAAGSATTTTASTSIRSGTTSATGAASLTVVPDLSSEVYTAPQMAALRHLLDMKGKLPPDELESLTREYHRTYGTGASLGGTNAAVVSDPDPMLEVMSKLIREFKDVTHCSDVNECRRYIELCNMDLDRAVGAYIDAML